MRCFGGFCGSLVGQLVFGVRYFIFLKNICLFQKCFYFCFKFETMAKVKKVKKSYDNLQLAVLAEAFGRSPITIQRWAEKNDARLESDKARAALATLKSIK